MDPAFFPNPADLQRWFAENAGTARELHVGCYKKDSGRRSITWPEAVDEALCVGWIDGVRRRLDDESYAIRFTPRKPGSIWSAVNIARVAVLTAAGRMQPPGLAAFEKRRETKSKIYAYEQEKPSELPEAYAVRFRADPAAWAWFQKQAPWYRRTTVWQIVSAKQEATRMKRLEKLIAACARGERLL